MPVDTETTLGAGNGVGSLEYAGKQIEGLLSLRAPKEDSAPVDKQPEQVPATPKVEEPKQAPAAPETEETPPASEPAKSDDEETPTPAVPQPRTLKVKDGDQETEVTEEEAVKGYLRTQDYTRKTQALAEERRKFEEGVVQVARERDQQYATHLGELKTAIKTLMPEEPNWEKLRNEVTPDVFANELLTWKQRQDRIATIEEEQAKVAARQKEDADRGFAQYVTDQQAKLEEALPAFKEPEKALALKKDLADYALSRGFTTDDLKQVTDHRLVVLLHDAMQHEKAKKNKPAIENKIEQVIEASAAGSQSTTPKRNARAEAIARTSSGRLEDAAAAIAHLL